MVRLLASRPERPGFNINSAIVAMVKEVARVNQGYVQGMLRISVSKGAAKIG